MLDRLRLGTIGRIVSQVNIEEIRKDVEQPFHLLIVATENDAANNLACLLSDLAGNFVHPWLTTTAPPVALPARGQDPIDLAILLSHAVDLPAPLQESYRRLASAQVPTLLIITGEAAERPDAALARRYETQRIAVPALDAAAVRKPVAEALFKISGPELRLALARRLPPLRPAAFNSLIGETAQANAAYAFSTGLAEMIPALGIPLNVGDLIVLTKNQLIMAYQIALIAGKQGSPQQLIGEIASVLGGGFLFRQVARQLIGLIPVWGIAPKVAVAYAGTWAIGQAVVLWAVEGQQITPDLLRKFYAEALARGQLVAQRLADNTRDRLTDLVPSAGAAGGERFWQKVRRRLALPKR